MSSLSVQTSGAAREAVDRHVPALVGDRFAMARAKSGQY